MFRFLLAIFAATLIPACGLSGSSGHGDHKLTFMDVGGTPFKTPMGYTVCFQCCFQNHVENPKWDYFPSDPDYLTRDSALVAVDAAVENFIATHATLNPDLVRSTLRGWGFVIVDDYLFGVHTQTGDFGYQDWATGLTDYTNHKVMLAVWARGTTQYSADPTNPDPTIAGVPITAPPHTVYGPDF